MRPRSSTLATDGLAGGEGRQSGALRPGPGRAGDLEDVQFGKKRDTRWENQGVRGPQRKEKLAYKIRWTRLYMQAAAKRFEYAELYARRSNTSTSSRARPRRCARAR